MSHDDQAASGPRRPRAPRSAPLAVGAVLLVVLGLGVGIIRLNEDGRTTVPECGAEGPSGPTPCRFPCVALGGGLVAHQRKTNDLCLHDPAATTTAPSNGLQPVTPAPVAGGPPVRPG
jgi:hypothetical protein